MENRYLGDAISLIPVQVSDKFTIKMTDLWKQDYLAEEQLLPL